MIQEQLQSPPTRPAERVYTGETYYDLPALKPPHYRWLIIAYFFVGGLASAAQFLAAVVDLFGHQEDRPLVRAGRYLALAGALVSPPLLIIDLHTPQRWVNMLRIFRRTSAMSIGSWALSLFGLFSGLAAVGQGIEDLLGWRLGRWLARLAGLPAALFGGVVAAYTGTLIAATNVPLWSSGSAILSSLFASSAASTAAAALSLLSPQASPATHRRLAWFGLAAGLSELVLAGQVEWNWRRTQVGGPVRKPALCAAWWGGVFGLGILVPLILHVLALARGRETRRLSNLAGLSALIGGFLLRAVFILGGRESALRPRDYFRVAQPPRRNRNRR